MGQKRPDTGCLENLAHVAIAREKRTGFRSNKGTPITRPHSASSTSRHLPPLTRPAPSGSRPSSSSSELPILLRLPPARGSGGATTAELHRYPAARRRSLAAPGSFYTRQGHCCPRPPTNPNPQPWVSLPPPALIRRPPSPRPPPPSLYSAALSPSLSSKPSLNPNLRQPCTPTIRRGRRSR
jgi:hypothetical protein